MASRGDVVELKTGLGFGSSSGEAERLVVVQDNGLNQVLDTTVVVPLTNATPALVAMPLNAGVSANEAGTAVDQVAITTHLRTVLYDRLKPGAVGTLNATSLANLDAALKVVLNLR